MTEYHKIETVFKRDPDTKLKTLLLWDFSQESFGYLRDNEWIFTEKVDGTNVRVILTDEKIQYAGKTDSAQLPPALIRKLDQRFIPQLSSLLSQFPDGACLYGEGYGAKIQKGGGNYRPDQDFVLFDVRVGDWWLRRPDIEAVAISIGVDIVPIIARGTLEDMVDMVQEGFDSKWGPFPAEGIVARPPVELKNRDGSRVITKLKCKDFPRKAVIDAL